MSPEHVQVSPPMPAEAIPGRLPAGAEACRAPYEPPELVPFGSAAHLTAGPSGGVLDGLFGGDGGFLEGS